MRLKERAANVAASAARQLQLDADTRVNTATSGSTGGKAGLSGIKGTRKSTSTSTPASNVRRVSGKAAVMSRRQHLPTPEDSQSPIHDQVEEEDGAAGRPESDHEDSMQVARSKPVGARRPIAMKPPSRMDKGKQRAFNQDADQEGEDSRVQNDSDVFRVPTTRKTSKRSARQRNAASSGDDQVEPTKPTTKDRTKTNKSLSNAHVVESRLPSQTNKSASNAKASTSKLPLGVCSSAVQSQSARARSRMASVAPTGNASVMYSAMKPISMKTIYRSSPPRSTRKRAPTAPADEDEDNTSEEEFLLHEPSSSTSERSYSVPVIRRVSRKKRKPAVGEFEWDERSRSCVPKRERSRSRSMTAHLATKAKERDAVTVEPEINGPNANDDFGRKSHDLRSEDDAYDRTDNLGARTSNAEDTTNILDGLNSNYGDHPGTSVGALDAGAEIFEGNDIFESVQAAPPLSDPTMDIQVEDVEELEPPSMAYDFTLNDGLPSSSPVHSEGEDEEDSDDDDDGFERSIQVIAPPSFPHFSSRHGEEITLPHRKVSPPMDVGFGQLDTTAVDGNAVLQGSHVKEELPEVDVTTSLAFSSQAESTPADAETAEDDHVDRMEEPPVGTVVPLVTEVATSLVAGHYTIDTRVLHSVEPMNKRQLEPSTAAERHSTAAHPETQSHFRPADDVAISPMARGNDTTIVPQPDDLDKELTPLPPSSPPPLPSPVRILSNVQCDSSEEEEIEEAEIMPSEDLMPESDHEEIGAKDTMQAGLTPADRVSSVAAAPSSVAKEQMQLLQSMPLPPASMKSPSPARLPLRSRSNTPSSTRSTSTTSAHHKAKSPIPTFSLAATSSPSTAKADTPVRKAKCTTPRSLKELKQLSMSRLTAHSPARSRSPVQQYSMLQQLRSPSPAVFIQEASDRSIRAPSPVGPKTDSPARHRLASPMTLAQRHASRSPSPLAQDSRETERISRFSGSPRRPTRDRLGSATSPVEATYSTTPSDKQSVSPGLLTETAQERAASVSSSSQLARGSHSVSPISSPRASQPSLLQMLHATTIASPSRSTTTSHAPTSAWRTLLPASPHSPSMHTISPDTLGKQHPVQSTDVETPLLERIRQYRKSLSVEPQIRHERERSASVAHSVSGRASGSKTPPASHVSQVIDQTTPLLSRIRQYRSSLSVEPAASGVPTPVKVEPVDAAFGPVIAVEKRVEDDEVPPVLEESAIEVLPTTVNPRLPSQADMIAARPDRIASSVSPSIAELSNADVRLESPAPIAPPQLPDLAADPDAIVMETPSEEESGSESDSETEAAEIQRSLSRSRSLTKSPAVRRVLAPIDSPQLSPNVTVRRGRSTSTSSASTMSIRSKPNTPRRPIQPAHKVSFTELGTFDSSPISVAASIGKHSFEALDTSSEDDDDDDDDGGVRPSPSKQIALLQEKARLRYNSTGSSDSDSDELERTHQHPSSESLFTAPLPSTTAARALMSTPAKLLSAMQVTSARKDSPSKPFTSTPGRVGQTTRRSPIHSPSSVSEDYGYSAELASQNTPTDGAEQPDDSLYVEAGSLTGDDSLFVEPGSTMEDSAHTETEPADTSLVVEISVTEPTSELSHHETEASYNESEVLPASANSSAALDEARPRSALVAPTLPTALRPSPARRTSRRPAAPATESQPNMRSSVPAVRHTEHELPRRGRSHSVLSRQSSAISNTSTVVQVSSTDPKAAARAAAILKVHHHYIQEGFWPEPSPDPAAVHGNGAEGERVLDELLREAEMEVSMNVNKSGNLSTPDISIEDGTSNDGFSAILPSRSFRQEPTHRLGIWTRHDWRALEQCFIDERRRSKRDGMELDPVEVVRLFLENEDLRPEDCAGEWNVSKIELRVEALQARKEQKQDDERSRRERSTSFVSTACSRAPSEFLAEEESRIARDNISTMTTSADDTFLKVPAAISTTHRRYARSAEPSLGPAHLAKDRYSHIPRSTNGQNGPHRRAASLTEFEAPPPLRPKTASVANRISKLYPSLDELAAELRPKKFIPVRGRSVAAAVSVFEKIEEEQSMEVIRSRLPKRKASDGSFDTPEPVKRVRL